MAVDKFIILIYILLGIWISTCTDTVCVSTPSFYTQPQVHVAIDFYFALYISWSMSLSLSIRSQCDHITPEKTPCRPSSLPILFSILISLNPDFFIFILFNFIYFYDENPQFDVDINDKCPGCLFSHFTTINRFSFFFSFPFRIKVL